ncbi:hypothetical protein TRFO_04669 [Tritrichomonas foetus]|uniref:E2F/DP family winged-helix DNA-binding domain-containing protein n=1 Tax=Tritrichomonas foetus TaxID=1144522 RepID=A0A1J4KHF0_9EUKA|nr:hypothetical protein TRFO_04669 [Tritrichomonas foetus]|eukprot:OHT09086.1 hypothetical protein TRFO_04669 [Tritrichomonas foetus]
MRGNPFRASNQEQGGKEQTANFRKQIKGFVAFLDSAGIGQKHSFTSIYDLFQVKRRRLYDVINVLTAIGCSTRSGTDDMIWNGKTQILNQLKVLKENYRINNMNMSIDELFPVNNCVSLSSLTVAFLLLFAALNFDTIDLRNACAFFSRQTNRYKTTLCKMYQIILILGALDVVSKTQSVCQIKLLPPYYDILVDGNRQDNLKQIGHSISYNNCIITKYNTTQKNSTKTNSTKNNHIGHNVSLLNTNLNTYSYNININNINNENSSNFTQSSTNVTSNSSSNDSMNSLIHKKKKSEENSPPPLASIEFLLNRPDSVHEQAQDSIRDLDPTYRQEIIEKRRRDFFEIVEKKNDASLEAQADVDN